MSYESRRRAQRRDGDEGEGAHRSAAGAALCYCAARAKSCLSHDGACVALLATLARGAALLHDGYKRSEPQSSPDAAAKGLALTY